MSARALYILASHLVCCDVRDRLSEFNIALLRPNKLFIVDLQADRISFYTTLNRSETFLQHHNSVVSFRVWFANMLLWFDPRRFSFRSLPAAVPTNLPSQRIMATTWLLQAWATSIHCSVAAACFRHTWWEEPLWRQARGLKIHPFIYFSGLMVQFNYTCTM